MSDEWDDFMPDSGDNGISVQEAIGDVVIFFAKVIALILAVASIIGLFAYSIWREYAVFMFLTGN